MEAAERLTGMEDMGAVQVRGGLLWTGLAALLLVAGPAVAGVSWQEASQEAGIRFQMAGEVHDEESYAWPALPEILGGGACWLDADGDGYEDLYLVNQRYNQENPNTHGWSEHLDPHNKLYLNNGDGSFTEWSRQSGADSRAWGYGCSAVDHDGDGDTDLYVTNYGMNELFENQGNGTFTNVTAESGTGGQGWCSFEHRCMSTSSAWADYDLDGDLDLYVANYLDTNLTDAARGPTGHVGQINFLFRNEGDGTFTEVAAQAGVQGNPTDLQGSKSLGVVWFDHDLDGDPDLYVANDQTPNDFYENNGDGTFTEKSDDSGLADDRAGMGVTAGDYDRDGFEDLFFTHYEAQHNGFYRNLGDGTFEDRSGEDDLAVDLDDVGWGTHFLDHDLDGDLDLFVVNGHTEWVEAAYGQHARLFDQDPDPNGGPGGATWVEMTEEAGLRAMTPLVSRGAAFADADLDGDPDVAVVNNGNATAEYLEATSDHGNRWLTLELSQPGANPQAIGAQVTTTVGGQAQTQVLRAGSSFLSQNTGRLTFGLGQATAVDEVEVTWPDGGTSTFTDVAAGQVLRVDRATGALVADTLSPRTEVHVTGPAGQRGWWTGPVEATLESQDRGVTEVSGVDEVLAGWEGDRLEPYDGETLTASGDGVHRLLFQATDRVGNTEPRSSTAFKIDTQVPTAHVDLAGTRGQNGWWVSSNVTVTVSGQDATSGIHQLQVRYEDGSWTAYDEPFVLAGDGVHTIQARAIDGAGHISEVATVQVPIDHTPPTVELEHPGPGHLYLGQTLVAALDRGPAIAVASDPWGPVGSRSLQVAGQGQDATSGLARLTLLVDGAEASMAPSSPLAWAWDTGQEASGVHTVELVATDAAGHTATERVDVVLVSGSQEGIASTVDQGAEASRGNLCATVRTHGAALWQRLGVCGGSCGEQGSPWCWSAWQPAQLRA